jgi:hypothetical protein
MSGDITRTEPMTLSNIGGGALESDVQQCLSEIQEIFAQPGRYQKASGDVLKARISISIEISVNVESGVKIVTHAANLVRPKTIARAEQLFLKDGEFVVQPDIHQPALFALPKPGESKGA